MKELTSGVVKVIQGVELHLCPEYCGVVDRRRVIAYLFLTLLEVLIIPYHVVFFLIEWQPYGLLVSCAYLLVFSLIQCAIWKQAWLFHKGVAALFLLVAAKLMIDSVFYIWLEYENDNISFLGNIFVMFILAISALSLMLQTTAYIISAALIPIIVYYIYSQPDSAVLHSLKPILVGAMMIAYVKTYNMSKVTKGLRQPREINEEERKALKILAGLRDMDYDKAESLFERLTPTLRKRLVNHATEQLRKEEVEMLAWDMVCADLTRGEREICRLILKGKTLKEICNQLGKSKSNVTSQRCHIRKKLNLAPKENLRQTLECKIAEIRKVI